LLDATEVIPALVHAPPDLTAALTGIRVKDKESESIDKNTIILLFIYKE
jgi:hypothetical protein